MNKRDVRKLILNKRNSLSKSDVLVASKSIMDGIDEMIKNTGDMTLLAYMPLGNEIDLTPLLERILKGCYRDNYNIEIILGLPAVCDREMKFIKVKSLKDLKMSSFGIMEPDKEGEEIKSKNAHVIVPLIGLNKFKQRLGFGGGFYDRYFNIHRDNVLYGILYDFQSDLDFEGDEYDIFMDSVFIAKHG